MTKSLHRHCTFKTVLERKRRRSVFSAEMQRRVEKAQKRRAVADCSRHEQRRPRHVASHHCLFKAACYVCAGVGSKMISTALTEFVAQ